MSQGQNKKSIEINLIPLFLGLVQWVELMHAGASGADKKAAALDLGATVLRIGAGAVVANNPGYSSIAGPVIDSVVAGLNASGTMPAPPAPPAVVPPQD